MTMDIKLRAHVESLLLAERDRTVEALHRAEDEERESQTVSGGALARVQWEPAEAASDVQEEEADFLTITRASAHLAEVDAALRTLADDPDALAFCSRCGWAVERARLELVPWTRLCAQCARADGKVLPDLF